MAEGQSYKYDAFVSYSHAADDLLAPRLQAGLQRFAKPWWRRRAVRVFRDESSLSASPHLWGSITEALDDSSWFVLLLSPEAASSEWVNKEIDHWKSDPSRRERVLSVLTDGEFRWDGDVVGSAVPPSLRGVFDSEPRWVDLRFAKGENQLDLKNPEFAAAVADVASAIRGVPKDELESEEVRQHRRTIRTAWAAGILLLALGVAASIAAVFAFNEQARANREADRANQFAAEADEGRQQAQELASREAEQRQRAEALQAEAERARVIAESQALVLEAENVVDVDPQTSMHLAIAAIEGFRSNEHDTTRAVAALRQGIAANRVVARHSWGEPIAVHPHSGKIATIRTEPSVSDELIHVVVRDLRGSARWCRGITRWPVARMAFSPDGSKIAVVAVDGQVSVCDHERETVIGGTLGPATAESHLAFSPDGSLLAWDSRSEEGVIVWSVEENRLVRATNDGGSGPSFSPDGLLSYVSSGLRIVEPETGTLVREVTGTFDGGRTSWSPDGNFVAVAIGALDVVVVLDSATWLEVSRTPDPNSRGRPVWFPESDQLLLGGGAGLRIVHPMTGEVVVRLLGLDGNSTDYGPIPGTTWVAAATENEVVLIDAASTANTEVAHWTTSTSEIGPVSYIENGDSVLVTDGRGSYEVIHSESGAPIVSVPGATDALRPTIVTRSGLVVVRDIESSWKVRNAITGETLYESPAGWFLQGISESGSAAVIFDGTCDGPLVVDVVTATTSRLNASCAQFPPNNRRFVFSPDESLLVGSSDVLVGTILFDLSSDDGYAVEGGGPVVSFSRDGSQLLAIDEEGVFRVFSTAKLLEGFVGSEAEETRIDAHDGEPVWIAQSPDGSMAATSARGEPVRVWDLATGLPIGEFGGDLVSSEAHYFDFHPNEPWLLVASPPNEIRVFTLDVDELIAIAEARLIRQLTEAECLKYPGACPP